MNGRVFGKRFVAVALLLFGFVSLAGDGEPWMKAALMGVCAVAAILLFRRTPKDDAWERKRAGGDLVDKPLAVDDGSAKRGGGAGGWLVGATVLHVLAAPVLILRDLLKMQK